MTGIHAPTGKGAAAWGTNETAIREVYAAQARGDVEGYLSLLADDVVLHFPGRSRLAGDHAGKHAIRRHFALVAELSHGSFRTEVHDVLANDDHAVALIDARAERDGRTIDLPRVHVWHVRDGRPSELWVHPVDQYALDAYWD